MLAGSGTGEGKPSCFSWVLESNEVKGVKVSGSCKRTCQIAVRGNRRLAVAEKRIPHNTPCRDMLVCFCEEGKRGDATKRKQTTGDKHDIGEKDRRYCLHLRFVIRLYSDIKSGLVHHL